MKQIRKIVGFAALLAASTQANAAAVRVDGACSDLLSSLYANEYLLLGGQLISLRSCGGTEFVDLYTADLRERCVSAHVCQVRPVPMPSPASPPPAPRDSWHHQPPHHGGPAPLPYRNGPPDYGNYNGVGSGDRNGLGGGENGA